MWSAKGAKSGAMELKTLCLLVFALLSYFGSTPALEAVVPAPDGGYPGNNTAEGQNALLSLTSGVNDTAVGWFSLKSNADGQLNTAVGSGTLYSTVHANRNTAGTIREAHR